MSLRRNVLIFQLGALGDFVLTWPLALALSRIHPQSRIIYVTHAQKGALAEEALRVESADIEAGWHHLYADPAKLPPPAAKLLAGAHSVYSFIAKPGDAWCQNAHQLTNGADVCCLDSKPKGGTQHATSFVLSQLCARPAAMESTRQMIRSIAEHGLRRRTTPSTTIVIHPGSGSRDKCWPAGRFHELARRLRAAGNTVRIILGEVELERWPAAQIDACADAAQLVQPRTYVDLLRCLADAAVYIGNDSGPSHLAGVMGVATVCLFGPTDPVVWRPLGPQVHVIHRTPLDCITINEVMHQVSLVGAAHDPKS